MEPAGQIKTVYSALRHRWPVSLAVFVLCMLAGVAAVALVPKAYQAEALLLVDARWEGSSDPASALSASDTLTRLYIAEATSGPILQQVATHPDLNVSADQLARQVSATTVHGTTLLAIDAKAPSPSQAAAIANAVAQTLVDRNRTDVMARFDSSRTYLEGELTRLDAAIKAVQDEKVPNTAGAANDHVARLTFLQGQYNSVYNQLQNVRLAQSHGISSLSIDALAGPPNRPSAPDPVRYLLAAFAAGLVLGFLAALVVERLDDRLYTAEGLAEAANAPVVIAMPRRAALNGTHPPAASNPYALALASVLARYPAAKSLMVVAAAPRDRAEKVATGLGKAAAHSGRRVILVRADSEETGVPYVTSANGSGLTIVPFPIGGDPGLALGSLANGGSPFDFTVLSVASPQSDPVALSLAGTAKVAVLVATAKQTRFQQVRDAAESLRAAGVEVAASFLTNRQEGTREGSPALQ